MGVHDLLERGLVVPQAVDVGLAEVGCFRVRMELDVAAGGGDLPGQQVQERFHVADGGDVLEDDFLVRQESSRQARQGRVLVPGGADRATQRMSAFNNEFRHLFLHQCEL